MGATPIYALPYPAATDPADVPLDMQELADRIELIFGGVSATPPASPTDGQGWVYPADPAAGVMWRFRYRAASPNADKWEFVGGPPLFADVAASVIGGNAWQQMTPTIAIARKGTYLIRQTLGQVQTGTGGATLIQHGSGLTSSASAVFGNTSANGTAASLWVGMSPHIARADLAAGVTVTFWGHGGTNGCTFVYRSLEILPVRVS